MRPTVPTTIRVARHHSRWEVSVDGLTRPMLDWWSTRERAIDHALDRALDVLDLWAVHVVIVVLADDGSVEEQVADISVARETARLRAIEGDRISIAS